MVGLKGYDGFYQMMIEGIKYDEIYIAINFINIIKLRNNCRFNEKLDRLSQKSIIGKLGRSRPNR